MLLFFNKGLDVQNWQNINICKTSIKHLSDKPIKKYKSSTISKKIEYKCSSAMDASFDYHKFIVKLQVSNDSKDFYLDGKQKGRGKREKG